jgi:hypothetical protein
MVLVGLDREGRRSAVVVELKQWDASSVTVDGFNVRVGGQVHPHPSDQATGYRDYLADLSPAFADLPTTVRSCAFLHNATAAGLRHLTSDPIAKLVQVSPLFAGDQADAMAAWIAESLVSPPDSRFFAELESPGVKVSKHLYSPRSQRRSAKNQPGRFSTSSGSHTTRSWDWCGATTERSTSSSSPGDRARVRA